LKVIHISDITFVSFLMPLKSKINRTEYYKEYNKYYIPDKEKRKANCKRYVEKHPLKRQKSRRISQWKKRGIICFDWDFLYDIYIECDTCDFCHNPFKNSTDRHLDHDHSITDDMNIRGILCMKCNTADKLKD